MRVRLVGLNFNPQTHTQSPLTVLLVTIICLDKTQAMQYVDAYYDIK